MDELLKYWESRFYTGIISFLLAGFGFFISIRRYKHNPKLKPLSIFFLAYFLDVLISYYVVAAKWDIHLGDEIVGYVDSIDTIIEFSALFFVIRSSVVNGKMRKILSPLLSIFLITILIYFIYYRIVYRIIDQAFLQTAFTLEASILIIACAFYYVDLFIKEPKLKLTTDPFFWVVTGVAFFMLCTLPFSILGMYLVKVNFNLYVQLFTIFEIFYWILFLMIIKAYFCKPEKLSK